MKISNNRTEGKGGAAATASSVFKFLQNNRRTINFLAFLLIAVLVSYYFVHLKTTLARQDPRFSLKLLVEGTAPTPFQYRYLIPWLIKKTVIFVKTSALRTMVDTKGVVNFYEIFSTFLMLVGFRYYLSFFVRNNAARSVLAFSILVPLASNYLLARMIDIPMQGMFYMPLFMPYDTPSVMFFTFGLILIYRRSWIPYYPLFILATFNRETTCFLTMVYALVAYGHEKNSTIAKHVAAQAVIWIAIKVYLKVLFAANSGAAFDLNIMKSFKFMLEPYYYQQMISNLAGIWLIVALFYGRIGDGFLRRSVLVALPFYGGMMLVGNLYELRIFAELAPVLTPAAIVIIKDLLEDVEPESG